ncbi:MAG TPA: hypothetical protein VGU44_01945 [Gammaproteobacteria bacterium]|nr:hypothetical protein [Gammaproteobacteria bacterium]
MDSLINPPVDTLQFEPELPIVSEPSSIVASRAEKSEINQDQALEKFKETVNQWVQEVVSTRETTQNTPSSVTHLEPIAPLLQPAFDSAVEIIDPNTLNIIQRLIQAGVLSLGPNIKALPNRDALSESLKDIREKQLQQAKHPVPMHFVNNDWLKYWLNKDFLKKPLRPCAKHWWRLFKHSFA